MHKNALFLLKNCKNRPAPRTKPPASGGWGFAPRPLPTPWKFLATPLKASMMICLV